MRILAIVILVIGIVMTIFTGFNLITKEKVVDVGPVEVTADKKTPIYWSPITGVVLIVLGAGLFVVDSRRNHS